jgi:hypothetical protein
MDIKNAAVTAAFLLWFFLNPNFAIAKFALWADEKLALKANFCQG